MKQVLKDKLKELASLCIDKGLNFDLSHYFDGSGSSVCWSVKYIENKKIHYISDFSEVCADWADGSEQKIELCIQTVREFER